MEIKSSNTVKISNKTNISPTKTNATTDKIALKPSLTTPDPTKKSKLPEPQKPASKQKETNKNNKGKNSQTPSSDSDSEEEKKQAVEIKKPAAIVKNMDFRNKLDSLFKAGGNPMRMNDDCCSALRKKKSINPTTLANGKRASKTFGFYFFINVSL